MIARGASTFASPITDVLNSGRVQVRRVPHQVVLDAQVVAGRLQVVVVLDRDDREEDRVAEHGEPTIASGSQGSRAERGGGVGAEGVDARARARRQQRRRVQRDAHQRLQRQAEGRRPAPGTSARAGAGPQLPVKQQRHERGQAQRRQPAGRRARWHPGRRPAAGATSPARPSKATSTPAAQRGDDQLARPRRQRVGVDVDAASGRARARNQSASATDAPSAASRPSARQARVSGGAGAGSLSDRDGRHQGAESITAGATGYDASCPMARLTVVVPCYNEAARLDAAPLLAFVDSHADASLLLVDDGSTDATGRGARPAGGGAPGRASAPCRWRRTAARRRRCAAGCATRSRRAPRSSATWTPTCRRRPPRSMTCWRRWRAPASRSRSARASACSATTSTAAPSVTTSAVCSPPRRRSSCGRASTTPSAAPSCSAPAPALSEALSTAFLSRWAFDVELLGRLLIGTPGVPALPLAAIVEVPLPVWHDVKGSKLGVDGDGADFARFDSGRERLGRPPSRGAFSFPPVNRQAIKAELPPHLSAARSAHARVGADLLRAGADRRSAAPDPVDPRVLHERAACSRTTPCCGARRSRGCSRSSSCRRCPRRRRSWFAICFFCFFCFLIGWRTRLFHVLSFVMTTSLHNRMLFAENWGGVAIGALMVWTVFLPIGRRFSVDAVLASMRARRNETPEQLAAGRAAARQHARASRWRCWGCCFRSRSFIGSTTSTNRASTWKDGTRGLLRAAPGADHHLAGPADARARAVLGDRAADARDAGRRGDRCRSWC